MEKRHWNCNFCYFRMKYHGDSIQMKYKTIEHYNRSEFTREKCNEIMYNCIVDI